MQGVESRLRLGANLESNTRGRRAGVVDGTGTSLNILRDLVVVARGERREVGETVDRNGVLRRGEASGSGVLGELALRDVVRCLATDEEAVTAEDGVSGDGRALRNVYQRMHI